MTQTTHPRSPDQPVPAPVHGYVMKGSWRDPGENDKCTGFEDIFTKIDMCRKPYSDVGPGQDYVNQFVR
jgi:2,4'-dihydroxyacetophenone dioxygenase